MLHKVLSESKDMYSWFSLYSYTGIIRTRFKGYNLSPCIEAPPKSSRCKDNKFCYFCINLKISNHEVTYH
jgi:hypothetical protein